MKLQHGSGERGLAFAWTAVVAAVLGLSCGGGSKEMPPVRVTWVVGQALPNFDPLGPPDPVRAAIERLISRGLVEEDSTGRIVPAAAESVAISGNGLQYRFTLRPDLTFSDGSPCRSEAFREAIEAGVNRLDHATYAWLFSSIEGMSKARPGRPLPPLGIATPDPRTLLITLSRPDSLFLRKLAFPGAAVPWRRGAEGWFDGVGSYRIAAAAPQRLTLALRAPSAGLPDSIQIRFIPAASRVRALLRASAPDLVWPPPPDLLDQALPPAYQALSRAARPTRRLLLVLRPDLPPTSKEAARHALTSGLNRAELIDALGIAGEDRTTGLTGAPPYPFPNDDPSQVREWLERGDLGRSLHVVMAYSADGMGARVARTLQSEWARNGLDVELRPFREPAVSTEMLRRGGAQLLLVEDQAILATASAELASLVLPMRGPAVGAFRVGWMTREFDPWIWAAGNPPPLDAGAAQQRLVDEDIALPIANLPWLWVQRAEVKGRFHPRLGPDPIGAAP
ncbi:MAG TPA: ABC transporter substrate-binding protein [Candidatus Eisenbacteria bacterium]|nr:ABC transporter substrate-binding protein [Candidatus Eisenbacteria bacterium]